MIGVKKVGVCVVIFASPSGHVACRHRKLTDFCTRPPGKGKMRNAENRQRGILRKRDPCFTHCNFIPHFPFCTFPKILNLTVLNFF